MTFSQAFAQGFVDDTSGATSTPVTTTSPNVSVTTALGNTTVAPTLNTTLEVKNLTQNKNAYDVQNRGSDLLEITMTVENKGPGTLSNYVPVLLSEELFQVAELTTDDMNRLLTVKAGKQIDFPVELAIAPNAPLKTWKARLRIKSTACADKPQIAANGIFLSYESLFRKLSLTCGPVIAAAGDAVDRELLTLEEKKTTATPVANVKKAPPRTPDTGPQEIFLLFLALCIGYFYMKKKSGLLG